MEFKVLSVLKKFMSEEQYEAFKEKSLEFETELNSDITKYVTTNTPKKEDLVLEAKKTAHAEVIAELKIKGVETSEQLIKHMETVKLSDSDQAKEILRLGKELEDKTSAYDLEVVGREKLEGEAKTANEINLIKGLGVTDEKQIKFMHWDFNEQVTDEKDYATVVEEFAKTNNIKTSTKFIKGNTHLNDGADNIASDWLEKNKKR